MQKLEEKLQEQLNLAIEYDFPDVYLTIPVEEGKRLLELMAAKGGLQVPSRLQLCYAYRPRGLGCKWSGVGLLFAATALPFDADDERAFVEPSAD